MFVKLDGKDIGYSKVTCCNFPYSLPCSISFEGFVHTDPSTGNIYYKAFKFGALKPAAGADIIQHLDEIQAGRIEIRGEEVVQLPGERVPQPFSTRWATDAANKRLPEGEGQHMTCSRGWVIGRPGRIVHRQVVYGSLA